jgi:hypothetical protein
LEDAMRKRLVDPDEMAAVSSMPREALIRLARLGKVPCVRFSRKCLRFDADAVIAALTSPGTPRPGAIGQEGGPE